MRAPIPNWPPLRPYDANLYQIGNNVLHRYIYRHAMQTPGIITLHDVVLYYLMYHTLITDGDTKSFLGRGGIQRGRGRGRPRQARFLQGRAN